MSTHKSMFSLRFFIVLGLNDMSTLVGHFVSSPREREKRDSIEKRGTLGRKTVLALTVKIRKAQGFLAPIYGRPGDQIFSLKFRNSTSIFLNSFME